MRGDDGCARIVEEVEYLIEKQRRRNRERLRLVVEHGYHLPGAPCTCGETVEQAIFFIGPRPFPLALSLSGLVALDMLTQRKSRPLTATQIERIAASDPFYVQFGKNAPKTPRTAIRLNRHSIKGFVQRIRQQLGQAIKEASLSIRPEQILVSEKTEAKRVVAYRLGIPCEIVHCFPYDYTKQ